jgi:hypothetical protein
VRRGAVREQPFAAAEHDREREDARSVNEVVASSACKSSVLPWVTRFGPSSSRKRFTSANSRSSTESCQLVSTSPERETTYFLMSLNSFAMPPWAAVWS